jgi:hypothetical protein
MSPVCSVWSGMGTGSVDLGLMSSRQRVFSSGASKPRHGILSARPVPFKKPNRGELTHAVVNVVAPQIEADLWVNSQRGHVRSGSKSDVAAFSGHVCFTPESGHSRAVMSPRPSRERSRGTPGR